VTAMTPGAVAPDAVDAWWDRLDTELAAFPARPVLTPAPARTCAEYTGYEVAFSALDGHRLFGYLSVPAGPGPFPGLLELPRHGSVNNPPHHNERLRYVVFTSMHRGQRRADSPAEAAYPGLFTRGITEPDGYAYRAVVADCLRAAEVLAERPEVNPARVGVTGDDLVLLTAARRPLFTAARVTAPLLHAALARRHASTAYPWEELSDHLRHHAGDEPRLAATLALFEPAAHAAGVRARTLLVEDPDGGTWTSELITALGAETYRRTGRDATDADATDAWLAAHLGTPALTRFS
jgi:cephalosporin-C deacetylase-like acetyl esterase